MKTRYINYSINLKIYILLYVRSKGVFVYVYCVNTCIRVHCSFNISTCHLALFVSLEGNGRECLGKKGMRKWKNLRKMGGKGFGGLTFPHNTKLSSFGVNQKGVLEGLYEFCKFNLCCYKKI